MVTPDPPGQANVYAASPRGPDGRVQVRYYFAHDGRIVNYTDPSGAARWRSPTPAELRNDPDERAATPNRVHDPFDPNGLTDALTDLNHRPPAGSPNR